MKSSKILSSKDVEVRRNVQPFRLPRRAFLRSASALGAGTIWLPALEAMFNASGTAHADGTAKAKRFIQFVWGVSYTSASGRTWAPRSGSGPLPDVITRPEFICDDKYQAKIKGLIGQPDLGIRAEHLTPSLTDPSIKKYIRIIDGIGIGHIVSESNQHYQAAHAVWTLPKDSAKFNESNEEWGLGPSLDRYISSFEAFGGATTPLQYLGVVPISNYGGIDFAGSTKRLSIDYAGMRNGNFSGQESKTRIEADYDPQIVFDRVFGAKGPGADDPALRRQRSILDSVEKVSKSTLDRMSKTDRQMVDVHLDTVRQLEKSLMGVPSDCGGNLTRPESARANIFGQLKYVEKRTNTVAPRVAKDMRDLIRMMVACDYCRTIIFMPSAPISGFNMEFIVDMANLGPREATSMHRDSHDSPKYHRMSTPWHMGQLGALIKDIEGVPEAGASALDSTFIWASSENGPQVHSMNDVATIVAGGPALVKGNQYVNPGSRTIADMHVGILNTLGLDSTGYKNWVKPRNLQPLNFLEG